MKSLTSQCKVDHCTAVYVTEEKEMPVEMSLVLLLKSCMFLHQTSTHLHRSVL